ncbi:hypothetical protein ABF79_05295 [Enterobacter hormaechei subsp. steigerwaltii]|nr:hypothetical protein ABF79_05295 [Enterobacter hormaechei subsp. steigerwaltii]
MPESSPLSLTATTANVATPAIAAVVTTAVVPIAPVASPPVVPAVVPTVAPVVVPVVAALVLPASVVAPIAGRAVASVSAVSTVQSVLFIFGPHSNEGKYEHLETRSRLTGIKPGAEFRPDRDGKSSM